MASLELMQCFYEGETEDSIPIYLVYKSDYKKWEKQQTEFIKQWVQAVNFKPKDNQHFSIPDEKGNLASILVITNKKDQIWALSNASRSLQDGKFHIHSTFEHELNDDYFIGWALGCYRFQEYVKSNHQHPKLNLSLVKNKNKIEAILDSTVLVRDMVNTPASDMMPEHIADCCKQVADHFQGSLRSVIGEELLEENFPVIHAVGRASKHKPQLIEILWGESKHKKVTLVGKGVSFDSGGLNIKSGQGMRLMKKDMGGAAHVLAIASAIMHMNLPIQLQVLIPAVENAISGDAYRPGDILHSRSGKTIEIDNTDAEGRLILCDAITKAIETEPDLLIDFATLTGAARVALGTEVPAFFSNDKIVAEDLLQAAEEVNDMVWELPLHAPYRHLLNSDVADFTNCATSGFGGAITAALFLKEFVPDTTPWVHFDVMAWNTRNRPGRPKGGEAMGLRAVIELLEQRYSV